MFKYDLEKGGPMNESTIKIRLMQAEDFDVVVGIDEVKKKNAVGFVDRGIRKEISFIPEIAAKECWDCKECFPLCPTEALQAAYVLVQSLIFPPPSCEPS